MKEKMRMSIEENARILRDLHAAINKRDLDKAMSFFADDARYITMPSGTCNSKDEIRKYFEKLMKAYEKFNMRETRPPVVSGDTATHEYMVDAKLKGGPEGSVSAVAIAEFRNGRITQLRNYVDKLEAAKQLAKGTLAKRTVGAVAKRVEALVNP
jgi:uncharacterized protein (TIGR02246 family)